MTRSFTRKKHYLVTGGCGFIGSHLVDALVADGHAVTALDNLSTGKRENLHSAARLIVGDTTDYATVEHALQGMDGCFHLAAIASVEQSNREWAMTHRVNIASTVNIFQAVSRKNNKIPVVYTSSAAVYGACPRVPLSEDDQTFPLTAYGVDKLACDLHGSIAWNVHGVPNTGLRPFNIYGPRQEASSPYSGVISIFAERIKHGQSLIIYGDGEQVRDFVYVGDAVKVFRAAMASIKRGHEIINICTGRPTSLNQLVAILSSITGKQVHRHYAPARKGDIQISIGNPSKLHGQLGLTLDTTLQQGLSYLNDETIKILPMQPVVEKLRHAYAH